MTTATITHALERRALDRIARGDIVVLAGRSLKGKNRVREHGDRWYVTEVDRSVLSPNLGFLLCPEGTQGNSNRYARWVRRYADNDMEIVAHEPREEGR